MSIHMRRERHGQRLPSEVASVLEREIREGLYGAGERLPTEAALVARFEVSRTAVREAIAELRSARFVRTHQGRGTFVAETLPTRTVFSVSSDILAVGELNLIYEIRREVEAGAAALAAMYRTEADLARMHTAIDALKHSVERDRPGAPYDLAFHDAVATACGNRFFAEFLSFFSSRVAESIAMARSNTARYSGRAQLVQHEHQSILEAISAGEPEQARAAMRTHLSNAMRRLGIRREENPR